MEVKCPTCEKAVAWSKESESKPFCSERCRLIDLGQWASEEHRIPCAPQEVPLGCAPQDVSLGVEDTPTGESNENLH
ncbi:DNA gyrase inhibitor YacG [Gammaproteobacteria bacterium AH-315-C21]|nr:DNA gyrase inhibitor YacG [Gammaproteobacteria bacterium AH-315-C21]